MNTIYKFIGSALVIIGLQGCAGSDWLDPQPLSFYAPENVYIDAAGFEALLVTMRKNIKSEHYADRTTMVNEYAMSDLGVPGAQSNTVVKDFPRVLTPAGDGNHNFHSRLFNGAYDYIRSANVLISRIDNVEWTDEAERNRILALGYFYRSYWYYRLVNAYGDVPYIQEETTEPKLDFYTHSRWAILERIQSEMEWAVQWMPEVSDPGGANRAAGQHLLSKIALANLDFDQAIASATAVINGPHALMTERFGIDADKSEYNVIWDLHRPENIYHSSNTETIFAVIDRFEDPEGAKTDGNRLPRAYNPAWWHSRCRDSEGNAGMTASGPQYSLYFRGNGNVRLTPYYIYHIWDFDSDLRRSDINWVEWDEILYNNPNSVDFGKPVNRAYFANPVDTFQHSYSFPFYITYIPEQDPAVDPRGGNGDTYIFRLAETYLLRAEAYFWKNDLAAAAADINAVRTRAQALPVDPSQIDLDFIFDERARELFTESPRHGELIRVSYILAQQNRDGYSLEQFSSKNYFFDRVMRTNLFFQVNLQWGQQEYRLAPHNALWPIPESVITANTLGVINQNQGYFGAENNLPPLETIE